MSEEERKRWLGGLFTSYHDKITGFFYKKLRSQEEAEDLASRVFVELSRCAAAYDPSRSSESTWVYTICRNLLNRHLRDSYTHARILPFDRSVSVEETNASDKETEREIERFISADALSQAMSCLGADERDIIVFSFYQELSPAEIAERMGITYGNVCVKKTRAIRALEAALK